MITMKELNPKGYALTEEQEFNLKILHERVNRVRALYGKPMIITSGVRSIEHHKRVYLEKAKKAGLQTVRIPMGSMHLKGAACDVYDPNRELQKWCLENAGVLAEIGLWMEHFSVTPNWVHFQIFPPKSGKRFFYP